MNITTKLLNRINQRLTETKSPCKLYATESSADKAGLKVAEKAAKHFSQHGQEDIIQADYIVIYIPSIQKWTPCINLTALLSRRDAAGGYLGICGDFYTY